MDDGQQGAVEEPGAVLERGVTMNDRMPEFKEGQRVTVSLRLGAPRTFIYMKGEVVSQATYGRFQTRVRITEPVAFAGLEIESDDSALIFYKE